MHVSGDSYIKITQTPDFSELKKGLWITIINATRIPPHIGLLFNGCYFSLNIKGVEKNVDMQVLIRKIEMKQIKSVFVKIKKHPVFSVDFLKESFETELMKYSCVSSETTCFKPVRTFFCENYMLQNYEMKFLYDLFPALYENNMIDKTFTMNMDESISNGFFVFKKYSEKDIDDKLNQIKQLQLNND